MADVVHKLAVFFMEKGFGGWNFAWIIMGFRDLKQLGPVQEGMSEGVLRKREKKRGDVLARAMR